MRILTRPNLGGPTRQAIALWHAHRRLGVTTLLVTGSVDGDESVLSPSDCGVPRQDLAAVLAGVADGGWLEIAELGRGLQPLRDRRAGRALLALIKAWRPDVVHTHTSKAGWLGRRAATAAGLANIAHTFHGHVLRDYFGPLASSWLRRQERRLARSTRWLCAVSPSCAEELADLGVAGRDRIAVVPPAVSLPAPLSRETARERLGIGAAERRAVAVGRLVAVKRLDHFIAMIGMDPTLGGDIHGEGPRRAVLERAIAARAAGRVTLRGSTLAAAALLPAYDALVLPSAREGCPLVAIEAFAAGVPVIGYDVPGVRDALADWGRGVLVPEADGPAGLLAGLRRLEGDRDLRGSCIDGGRRGLGHFDPDEVARQLLALYRRR